LSAGVRLNRVRLIGLTAAFLVAALLAAFTGALFAEPLFDRYQRWSPHPIAADTRVHIVRIDAESLRAPPQGLGRWPWPRSYLALLTDRLRAAGAVAIGYDIVFAEADPATDQARIDDVYATLSPAARAEIIAIPSLDQRFGDALGRAPTVVARTALQANDAEAQGLTAAGTAALAFDDPFTTALPATVPSFELALANVIDIDFNAQGHGLINGNPDNDGVTRRLPMVALVAGHAMPSLSLELARIATKADAITPVMTGGALTALQLGRHRIPVSDRGEARLHFGTLPDGSETSAANIIRQPRKPGALAGKIVLIGPASVGLGDVRSTPLGRTEYGVRFHAQAIDAILNQGWLVRPRWALTAEWGLGMVLAALAIIGLPRLRWRWLIILPALAVVVIFGGSMAAFLWGQTLLDPLRPLLIGGVTALTITAALFAETTRLAKQLREAALAQAGEMKAAREIQRAMLPDAAMLARLDPRLDLDAVLEPAQAIGGDLYDAFALPDGRIVFLVGDVTGKGPSAALFMAVSKALAHSLLRRGGAPLDAIIGALNDELQSDGENFVEVTLLCGIIDLANGRVDLVNAGHENPLVRRADGTLEDVVMEGGLPLCTMPGYAYPLESLALAPGDGLVIITDGVREAQNDSGGFFGSDRTRDVLLAWGDGPAGAATRALITAVRAFEDGAPASDDLTVMALRYRG
jgi:serine phosphatase RsbU (regulator of sigma subunit)